MAEDQAARGQAAVDAAAARLGVAPELARKLVSVEYDAQGQPAGVDEALGAVLRAHPELIVPERRGRPFDPANPPRLGQPGLFGQPTPRDTGRGDAGDAPGAPAPLDPKDPPRLGWRGLFKRSTGG